MCRGKGKEISFWYRMGATPAVYGLGDGRREIARRLDHVPDRPMRTCATSTMTFGRLGDRLPELGFGHSARLTLRAKAVVPSACSPADITSALTRCKLAAGSSFEGP
jgi:hypothetical protein